MSQSNSNGSIFNTPIQPTSTGFGLPGPIQSTASFVNAQLLGHGNSNPNYNYSSNSSGPQPHPVPSNHGPATPIHIPNKSPAPTRGCSPTRFRVKMQDASDRGEVHVNSATTVNNNNNINDSIFVNNNNINRNVPHPLNDSSSSPNIRQSGPLANGGLNFVVDNRNNYNNNNNNHSPSGASCPVCGALRLPTIDLRNDAALAVLDRRKEELQREVFRIDQMMFHRKKTQSGLGNNNMNKAVNSSQSATIFNETSVPILTQQQQQQQQHQSPIRGGSTNGRVSPSNRNRAINADNLALSNMTREHYSLVHELRFAADSLLQNNNNNNMNSSFSQQLHRPAAVVSTTPRIRQGNNNNSHNTMLRQPVNVDIKDNNISSTELALSHVRNGNTHDLSHHSIRIPQQQFNASFSTSGNRFNNESNNNNNVSPPSNIDITNGNNIRFSSNNSSKLNTYDDQLRAAEDHVRAIVRNGATAGRPSKPASSVGNFPSLAHSPMRDEMYTDDHKDVLKELAMLRVEREMKSS